MFENGVEALNFKINCGTTQVQLLLKGITKEMQHLSLRNDTMKAMEFELWNLRHFSVTFTYCRCWVSCKSYGPLCNISHATSVRSTIVAAFNQYSSQFICTYFKAARIVLILVSAEKKK